MAAINFPDSPSNGDTHVVDGVTYTYNSAETKWKTTINSNAFLPLSGGNVTGNLSVDTDTLFVDASTDRVGINTSSPLAELEVQGAATPEVMVRNTTTSSYSSLHLAEVGDSSGTFVVNRLGSTSTATGGARAGQIWNSANAPIVFATNGTEEMRLLSGGGLTFNGDTAAANALDDYEEGTFSPRLFGWTGSAYTTVTNTTTYTAGRYVKIGGRVTLFITYAWSSMPIANGNPWYIYDLPFSPEGQHSSAGSMALVNGVTNAYSFDFAKSSGYAEPLFIYARSSQSTYTNINNTGGAGNFTATITYFTES